MELIIRPNLDAAALLVARIVADDSQGRRARVQGLERIRTRNAVTLESNPNEGRSRAKPAKKRS
jgi:hypothetical protein